MSSTKEVHHISLFHGIMWKTLVKWTWVENEVGVPLLSLTVMLLVPCSRNAEAMHRDSL